MRASKRDLSCLENISVGCGLSMKIYHVYIDDYEGPYYSSYFVSQEKAMKYYDKMVQDCAVSMVTIREIQTED